VRTINVRIGIAELALGGSLLLLTGLTALFILEWPVGLIPAADISSSLSATPSQADDVLRPSMPAAHPLVRSASPLTGHPFQAEFSNSFDRINKSSVRGIFLYRTD